MSALSAERESSAPSLSPVAEAVVRRAQRQGFVRPKEVREELEQAGESPGLWKDVLALARASLSFRKGRYYYASPVSDRLRQEQDHQATIAEAARRVIGTFRDAAQQQERRGEERIDFIQPVQVRTEDGRIFTLLSRDLSTSGMRLIGTRSLLGQKVQVRPTGTPAGEGWCFVVRVIWTCSIGDELFENGGTFIEGRAGEPNDERITNDESRKNDESRMTNHERNSKSE
jgi:hypothetical protein